MKKGIAVILAVILILAGLAVAWATWRPGSGRTASYQEHTLELPAGQYDSLTVEELSRDIQVRPSEDGKIHITYYTSERYRYTESTEGGQYRLRAEPEASVFGLRFDFQINFDFNAPNHNTVIYLPEDLKEAFTVTAAGGDISMEGVNLAGPVSVKNVSGDIALSGCAAGDLSVASTSGDTALSAAEARSIQVTAVSGDIALTDCVSQGTLSVTGTSGDIRLDAPVAGELLAVSTSGDVLFSNPAFSSLTVHTTSGDITGFVSLSRDEFYSMPVDMKSTSGDIALSFLP